MSGSRATVSQLREEAEELRKEIFELEIKRKRLKALEEYISTFPEEIAPQTSVSGEGQTDLTEGLSPGGESDFSKARPKTRKMLEAAFRVLKAEAGRPVLTRDLVRRLEEDGIEIGGQDSVGTLSAALSHNKQIFRNLGRNVGWALVSDSEI